MSINMCLILDHDAVLYFLQVVDHIRSEVKPDYIPAIGIDIRGDLDLAVYRITAVIIVVVHRRTAVDI